MVLDRAEGRETLRSCVNAAGAVFSVDGAPRLQIKCEGVKKMKNTLIVAGLAVAGFMGGTNIEGRTGENVTVKSSVFFTAGKTGSPPGPPQNTKIDPRRTGREMIV